MCASPLICTLFFRKNVSEKKTKCLLIPFAALAGKRLSICFPSPATQHGPQKGPNPNHNKPRSMTIIPSHLSQNYIPIFTRLPHYIPSRWQYRSFNQIRWLTLANPCINTPPKPLLPARLFISPPPSPLPRPLVRPFRGRLRGSHPLVLPCNLRNCPYHLRVVPTLHDFLLPPLPFLPPFVYSPIAIAERFRLVSSRLAAALLAWRHGGRRDVDLREGGAATWRRDARQAEGAGPPVVGGAAGAATAAAAAVPGDVR